MTVNAAINNTNPSEPMTSTCSIHPSIPFLPNVTTAESQVQGGIPTNPKHLNKSYLPNVSAGLSLTHGDDQIASFDTLKQQNQAISPQWRREQSQKSAPEHQPCGFSLPATNSF